MEAPKIVPGKQMTEEEKSALAKYNAEETDRAHKMAADRRAQDANEPPLIQTLQGSIKKKLEELPPEPGTQEGQPQQ